MIIFKILLFIYFLLRYVMGLKNKEKMLTDSSMNSNDRIIRQIRMLSELKDEGVLTENEFNDKKRLLLNKLE